MGGGLLAGLLLALIVLVLLAMLGAAIVLFIIYGVRRARGRQPSFVLPWIGFGLVLAVAALVVAAIGSARSSNPDPLELDLRRPVQESSLPGEEMPGFPGFYDYTTDHVDWRLPEGRRFRAEVDKVVLTVDGGKLDTAAVSYGAASPSRAQHRVEAWARELRIDAPGLDDAIDDPSTEWAVEQRIGRYDARLSLQPVSDGEFMIARFRVDVR